MTGMSGPVSSPECGMERSRYIPYVNAFLLQTKLYLTPHNTRRFDHVWSAKLLNIHVLHYSHYDLRERHIIDNE